MVKNVETQYLRLRTLQIVWYFIDLHAGDAPTGRGVSTTVSFWFYHDFCG
jgi:hypothetical protein